ncbi:MAG: hypothetical protein FWD60_07505, partial [Candidatus Azobacteroides sp.]|nr:hypothetical protein [Candidatus Azobacteroides sp.]
PTILARRAFIVNVLTDKICRLELYSIDMQALTGYRLSKTQVIKMIISFLNLDCFVPRNDVKPDGNTSLRGTKQSYSL